MSRYRDQIAGALRAVRILGPTRYAWLGRASRRLPKTLDAVMTAVERRSYLVGCLKDELYASFYCQGSPVPARWGSPEPIAADPWLVAAMSKANQAPGGWDAGWRVERIEDGELVASSRSLRVRASPADCRPRAGSLRPGSEVSLRLPKQLPAMSPGFFTVVGGEAIAHWSEGIVRVYWNVGPASAAALVHALTTQLTTQQTAFQLKVADHPARLDRCDAAILYLPMDSFGQLRRTLRGIADDLARGLGSPIPAMTLQLAAGVGLAEDLDASESFGARRCALLAEGVLTAHERGIVEPGARLEAVAARFAQGGVDIDKPYVDPALRGRHAL
jgi:HopA1 effector protein family